MKLKMHILSLSMLKTASVIRPINVHDFKDGHAELLKAKTVRNWL